MKKKDFALGILCGAMLFSGVTAAAAGITAEPTWQNIYVDGKQVSMTAYNIAGSNYVKLRDIGQQVGFNVYWADGVQIDTDAPYTGVAPVQNVEELPTIEEIRQEMIRRINEVRRENGVSELTVNQSLMDAAQKCSAMLNTSHKNKEECLTVIIFSLYIHTYSFLFISSTYSYLSVTNFIILSCFIQFLSFLYF